jgi:hypothetical protein
MLSATIAELRGKYFGQTASKREKQLDAIKRSTAL